MNLRLERTLLLLLTLCLIGAQTAASEHAISHLGFDAVAERGPGKTFASADHLEGFCLECLAFAQVTGTAHDNVHTDTATAPAAWLPVAVRLAAIAQRVIVAFRARAPPRLPA